ncbi:bifunctional nicotinamidase/pyrazinamidase [Arsenophonus nasoniae]|nr:bifunctional nicotinamidase/pyrazinamidase [Arsenophonus nasoniae]QBY43439.1 Peroxyureidoacrylate/ureidoacrylate amidohydrolase RutB [Arsenophonus nasoniae]WGM07737.1 bifunctional nicotinamidase/pyrazinamidase [Arsenophonus nasoniae]WGM12627.1 bifunctional nicotinamidase/pyrazinamidase [Arsenophonus nasoniae]WGM16976.1 bifunctional nicotinamidase/pyrazinamidase [Arsenophonus nasoniae]
MSDSALLLVDLQNDFCNGGALAVLDSESVINTANEVITYCQQHDIAIIASQDWHPADHLSFAVNSATKVGTEGKLNGLRQIWWPVHCVQHQKGAEFHPALNQSAIQAIFQKGVNAIIDSYSAFFDNDHQHATQLDYWLTQNQIKHLYIMGLATDYCVKFTVLDALQLGYQVTVIQDGCRGVNLDPEDSHNALQEMALAGAKLITSSDLPIHFFDRANDFRQK